VFELPDKDQKIYESALDQEEKIYYTEEETQKIIDKDMEENEFEGKQKLQKLSSAEWYLRYLSFK
jgi:hypothetical protein